MRIEVDQSGKIGDTRVSTVLAFSNEENHAILIPASVKRECIQWLRQHQRPLALSYLCLFAAGVFLLIRDHLDSLEQVTIDVEYPGHENTIRRMLLNHIRRFRPGFAKERIEFQHIGKRSRAHERAYAIYRGKSLPNRKVRARELLVLLR